MNDDDTRRLQAIMDAANDSVTVARLIHQYWRDIDRAERTPRALLYLHLGMLVGIVERLMPERAQ